MRREVRSCKDKSNNPILADGTNQMVYIHNVVAGGWDSIKCLEEG